MYSEKIDEIISLLTEYRAIIDSHVTAVYIVDYFHTLPDLWYDYLSSFTFPELLSLPIHLPKVLSP